jgi:hypothetical protein
MTAQLEEVVTAADPLDPEQPLPKGAKLALAFRPRRFIPGHLASALSGLGPMPLSLFL